MSEPVVDPICDKSMEVVVTNESGSKQQLAHKDEFVKSHKPVGLNKSKLINDPIKTTNLFETLRKDAPQLGPSKEATLTAQPIAKRLPPIVVKVRKVETSFINAVRAKTNVLVSFEYK